MVQRLKENEPRGGHCQLCGVNHGDRVRDHQKDCKGTPEYHRLKNTCTKANKHRPGYCDWCGDLLRDTYRHRTSTTCAKLRNPRLSDKNRANQRQELPEGKEYLRDFAVGIGKCRFCGKSYNQLRSHVVKCPMNPDREPAKACEFCSISVFCMSQHLRWCLQNPANHIPTPCRYCGEIIAERLYHHEMRCTEYPPNTPTTCQYCEKELPSARLTGHLHNECAYSPFRKPLICKWCNETLPGTQSSANGHEKFCFQNPNIPQGPLRCTCTQMFESYSSLHRHRHTSTHTITTQCPLAACPCAWDQWKVPPDTQILKCLCGFVANGYDEITHHTRQCQQYQIIYRAHFRTGQPKPTSFLIQPDISTHQGRSEAAKKLRSSICEPTVNLEWQKYLQNTEKAILWDVEGLDTGFIAHVFIAGPDGAPLVSMVIDNGSFEDLWEAREAYTGRRRMVYISLVNRYYGPFQSSDIAAISRGSLADLAAAIDGLHLSENTIALKWSCAYFDWRCLNAALSTINRQDCLPPLSNVVRPLVAIGRMYKLTKVVSFALQTLHAIVFPSSPLFNKHHEADVDVQKLFEVVQFFRGLSKKRKQVTSPATEDELESETDVEEESVEEYFDEDMAEVERMVDFVERMVEGGEDV